MVFWTIPGLWRVLTQAQARPGARGCTSDYAGGVGCLGIFRRQRDLSGTADKNSDLLDKKWALHLYLRAENRTFLRTTCLVPMQPLFLHPLGTRQENHRPRRVSQTLRGLLTYRLNHHYHT